MNLNTLEGTMDLPQLESNFDRMYRYLEPIYCRVLTEETSDKIKKERLKELRNSSNKGLVKHMFHFESFSHILSRLRKPNGTPYKDIKIFLQPLCRVFKMVTLEELIYMYLNHEVPE